MVILFFTLALIYYAISTLNNQGKFRFSDPDKPYGFFGEEQDKRKYKEFTDGVTHFRMDAPNTLYYRLIKSKYIEAWPTSTWLTVFATDAFHFFQSLFFLSLSAGIALAMEIPFDFWNHWEQFNALYLWGCVVGVHTGVYRIFQR